MTHHTRQKRRMSHNQLITILQDLVAAGAIAVIDDNGRARFGLTWEAANMLELMRSRDAESGDAGRRPSPEVAMEASV